MIKRVNLSLTKRHAEMLSELAKSKGLSKSRLVRKMIERLYKKYTKTNEESQDG